MLNAGNYLVLEFVALSDPKSLIGPITPCSISKKQGQIGYRDKGKISLPLKPASECFIMHCSCLKTKFEESFPVLLTRMVRICFRP